MPLRMHFTQGSWQPAALCSTCQEPLSAAAPGCWGYLANRDGNAVTGDILFVHDADECRRPMDWHAPYTFHGRPLSELAALL